MLAPPWLGRDLWHAQYQQGAAFEAFAAVLQSPAVRQRLDVLPPAAAAEAHAAALRFLLLFRPPTAAATDLWWAHFAALLHAVVTTARASRGGLQQPAVKHLVQSMCSGETAHMAVQLVLAHPAFQPRESSGTAGAGGGGRAGWREPSGTSARGRTGGRRKQAAGGAGGGEEDGGGGTAGTAGRVREALSVAAELLAHDVPAFLAGCCELLRPEANAALQTRVEALAGEALGRAGASHPQAALCSLWSRHQNRHSTVGLKTPIPLSTAACAAMGRAAAGYLEEQGGTAGSRMEAGQLDSTLPAGPPSRRLWDSPALDQLLWALRR